MSSTEARLESRRLCAVVKHMDHLLQLIRSCPLRDTEHSMSVKRHTTEQNMMTVEDRQNTADDGETHNEDRREIQTQQHNLLEAEHILQIRDSSGHEEQRSRSFHEAPWTDCVREHLRRNWDYAF